MKFKRFFLFSLSVVLGITALIFIIQKVGSDKIFRALRLFSWWHFLVLLLSVVIILFVYIKKWQILIRPFGYKSSWSKNFVAFLGSQTISFIMPVMYLAGEGFKTLLLKEDDQEKSFFKTFGLIIIDKLAESLGLLLFFLFGGIVLLFYHLFVLGFLMIFLSLIIFIAFFWGLKATNFFLFFIKILGFHRVLKDEQKRKEEVNMIEQYLSGHRHLFIFDVILSFLALVLSAL